MPEVALVVVLHPDAPVLRDPVAEGVDVVGDGLRLALQLVHVDAVEDELERGAHQRQREQEHEGELRRSANDYSAWRPFWINRALGR